MNPGPKNIVELDLVGNSLRAIYKTWEMASFFPFFFLMQASRHNADFVLSA